MFDDATRRSFCQRNACSFVSAELAFSVHAFSCDTDKKKKNKEKNDELMKRQEIGYDKEKNPPSGANGTKNRRDRTGGHISLPTCSSTSPPRPP